MSNSDAATQQAPGTLIRVNHGSRYTWHHSVSFDGYEHGTACGRAVDTDDIETVIMDLQKWEILDGRECCDECAGSVRSLVEDWDALHEKYEVYEDGDRVDGCFVLEPETDPAARAALIEYAEETDNEELAQDLRDWVVDICTEDEQIATDGGTKVWPDDYTEDELVSAAARDTYEAVMEAATDPDDLEEIAEDYAANLDVDHRVDDAVEEARGNLPEEVLQN